MVSTFTFCGRLQIKYTTISYVNSASNRKLPIDSVSYNTLYTLHVQSKISLIGWPVEPLGNLIFNNVEIVGAMSVME
jgi:hypothetical protein